MKYYITSFDKDNIPSTLSNKIFELPNFCSKSCQNDKNCSTDCENLKKIINKKKNQLNYRYMIKRWEDDKRIICVKDLCRLHK